MRQAWLLGPIALMVACGGGRAPQAVAPPGDPGEPVAPAGDVDAAAPPMAAAEPTLRLDGSVTPTAYAVELTLDPARDDFAGVITIDATLARATETIWLHGKQLTIDAATVGGQPATATLAGEFLRLQLPAAVGPGATRLELRYRGALPTDEMEGLFRQRENGRTYLYSQFEPTGARRAFPCFDEPAFKVPWQVTLHVPKGMVALGNTPIEREADDGPLHTVVFAPTRPLPSYLVAVAVGPFELIDLGVAGRNRTPLRLAVPAGRAADTRWAKQVTGHLLEHLEAYLDMPFPYPKLDSVAVPTFLGAMENPGLITYAEQLILAAPSEQSFAFERGYASVAAHEMAHHWFGDLVTMRWWDDIWLNESFADFMADRAVDDWQPTWGTRMHRLEEAQGAFAADALVSARKLHNPITRHEDILGVFDSISYAKGGALLAMFEAWVGRDTMRKVLHDYLTAHAWGNASSQDLIDALAAGSQPAVSRAFASFLEQGGIPMVTLDLRCDGDRAALVLGQARFLPIGSTGQAAQRWSVPMCVDVPQAGKVATQCFLFDAATATVPLTAPGCPAWVDGNAGGRGYYRVKYAGDLGGRLLAAPELDAVARAAALFNLRAMVDGGHAPMDGLLAALPAVAAARDRELVAAALELATSIGPYVDDALEPNYQRFLARTFGGPARALGWTPKRGEPADAATLRPKLLAVAALIGQDPALVASAKQQAARYLRDKRAMDPQLATLALATATRAGDPLARKLGAAFARSTDHPQRAALLAGMVMATDPKVRDAAVAQLGGGELTVEELIGMVLTAATTTASKAVVYDYITAHLDATMATLPFLVRPAVVRFAQFYCDAAHRQQLDELFAPKVGPLPGGEKELGEAREAIDVCIAKRAALGPAVSAFLGKQ